LIDCDLNAAPIVSGANRVVTPATGPYLAGTTVVYTCDDATDDVAGEDTTICQSNGQWLPATLGVCTQERKYNSLSNKHVVIDTCNHYAAVD